jgi:hypothetical protein
VSSNVSALHANSAMFTLMGGGGRRFQLLAFLILNSEKIFAFRPQRGKFLQGEKHEDWPTRSFDMAFFSDSASLARRSKQIFSSPLTFSPLF